VIRSTHTWPGPSAAARIPVVRHAARGEFHMYENAGHAFFAVDRPQYRQAAAVDGWRKVFGWFDKYLR
jgi:carboxymethylenebutenolidase